MSYSHVTVGWDKIETMIDILKALGISLAITEHGDRLERGSFQCYCYCGYSDDPKDREDCCDCGNNICNHRQRLRIVRFKFEGQHFILEEYLAVDDDDCDGVSIVDVAIYKQGERPNIVTVVVVYNYE